MRTLYYDTLVVGSGVAGYNAIDWLTDLGRKEVALVTEGVYRGTSRNTGSDKQTYYKLSLAGKDEDSIHSMAETLFSGGSMDGYSALCEAASSVKCFMKLNLLGVEFPVDKYGQFVGYKTDHDPKQRATSAGPLTSKFMTEVLEKKVKSKNVSILDGYCIIKVIIKENSLKGLVALYGDDLVFLRCNNVIWCTGGPSGIYFDSVYPESQRGMSGILLNEGAKASNLLYWQFGIASTAFRWNLSGTYQQVLPKYVSIDENGEEHEFLIENNIKSYLSKVFLKGYQWPFDSRKIEGSSSIDLAVYEESIVKKRKVFLDYRTNPSNLSKDFSELNEEAFSYLEKSDALFGTPYERLKKMNPLAIELYLNHGIDLKNEMLEIKVCVQNHNGGIKVDENWKSSIDKLYVAGEAAGTFGPYRPGGSALNSSQVGSMRAAEAIINTTKEHRPEVLDLETKEKLKIFETIVIHGKEKKELSALSLSKEYQEKMSAYSGFIRDVDKLKIMEEKLEFLIEHYFEKVYVPKNVGVELLFTTYDQLITSLAVISSILNGASLSGSYGGALVKEKGEVVKTKSKVDNKKIITEKNGNKFISYLKEVNSLPDEDLWFENVWNEYRKRKNL
ncbi:MAG: FAD-binding protein [Sphaerochaetaceae bacterium]